MPAENVTADGTGFADRLTATTATDTTATDTPAPPPEMPESTTSAAPVTPGGSAAETVPEKPTTTEEPAAVVAPVTKADGWEVDSYQLRAFSDAVTRARSYLDAVAAKVDRMQGAELDPQLGTSPVGTQLAKKFDDRLNSADGLRAMLAEAMKRMEHFVTSAEDAARAYEEQEQTAVDTFNQTVPEPPTAKRGR